MLNSQNTDFLRLKHRMEAVPGHNGEPAVTTVVVVREEDVSLPTNQVSLEHAVTFLDECHVRLFVDGVARDISTGSGRDDASVFVRNRLIKVEYPNTNLSLDIEMRLWSNTCHFSIDYVGILGSPDGNRTNDWMNEHGEPLEILKGVDEFFFKTAYDHALDYENFGKEYVGGREALLSTSNIESVYSPLERRGMNHIVLPNHHSTLKCRRFAFLA